jgi:hypothetical protein
VQPTTTIPQQPEQPDMMGTPVVAGAGVGSAPGIMAVRRTRLYMVR